MATNLAIESRDLGEWSVVGVSGEVDLYTAPQLRETLIDLVERGRHRIIVDLAGVEFLDSTGLGVLVVGLKRCREHDGDLALVAPQDPVHKVLTITRLDKVFAIHDDVDRATEA